MPSVPVIFLFFLNLGLGFTSSPSRYPDPPSADPEDVDTVIEDVAKDAAAEAEKITTEEAAKGAAEDAAKGPAGESGKALAGGVHLALLFSCVSGLGVASLRLFSGFPPLPC